MTGDIAETLITAERIHARVRELAAAITADHTPPKLPGDAEITIVPIMTGAMIFAADLIREIPIQMRINLMTVSSYPGSSLRTQGAKVLGQQLGDIHGRHVLLVDDILDSGGTIRLIAPMLTELGATSVKTCVLLRKPRPESQDVHADYVGFAIPDEFVVGYGLDYDSYYRNLPDIVTLTPAAIARYAR